jgi:Helicase conserved C-terminal domain
MDFDSAAVEHVVLYDFPRDPIEYMRRVGRTARAGRKGIVTVLAWVRSNPSLYIQWLFSHCTEFKGIMVIHCYPAVTELIVPHAKQYCCTLRYRSLAVDYVLYCMLYAHSRAYTTVAHATAN